ncbi:hypothetical protein [Bacillus massilinigeriensis]|uniref:hypothetical protein n=1 Tax=Bacillus mediterraneensis TaxID=1805474 RepID=UPI0008F85E85|nr:hypothetical protein [Bacillus mediterraneensis]
MNRKTVIAVSGGYVVFMALLAFYYYGQDESFETMVAAGGIACGVVPLLLATFTRLQFHLPLVGSYIVFLFASQYLGSIRGWYGLGWWDTFLHFFSGSLLSYLAVALYERLVRRGAGDRISPWFVFLFTFSFAVLGGVMWEVYEFSADQLFGMTLQGGGNKDTMMDLIADCAGGLLIAIFAAIRSKAFRKK